MKIIFLPLFVVIYVFAMVVMLPASSAQAQATPTATATETPLIPYYGHEFNQKKSQLKDEELKSKLKEILKSGHISTSVQIEDQIVPSCDATANVAANATTPVIPNCKVQSSLGYDGARVYLFGTFYLIPLGGTAYGVHEMYCDRVYTPADFKNGVGAPGPGIIPEGTVINTEHTWPQSRFTGQYSKDLQKGDLHHLFPTDSKMNALRGSSIFGEVIKPSDKTNCTASKYGQGEGTTRDVFEPPQHHKGHVARALFYFSIRYDLPISAEEEVVLKKWNRENPPDDQEILRNSAIQEKQGNRNPFIDYPELADQIQDF